jgi:hypothetical protein
MPASDPRLTPIDTTIAQASRSDTLGSPLSGGTLFDEPNEKQQQNGENAKESKVELVVDSPDEEEGAEWPAKYPVAPQHCRRWGKPERTFIRRGTIPAGPLHFTNPVPTLPEGWVEHTHLEGKLYYVRDASNPIQGAPFTLTIVTDSNPRDERNFRGLESLHRQVVEAIQEQNIQLPKRVQLFIELYPKGDGWSHVGGYYLADLDNQSLFWVEDIDSQDLGLGDKINFGVFGEQHLKLTLHRQFWYHIECYPLPSSIDEKKEHDILLKHLTFALLDVSTSPTSTSTYTASECSGFIEAIAKTPQNSRTWPIARVAGFMAEHRFWNYYGHPSARLDHLHAFEVEQVVEDSSDATAQPESSTWRRRADSLWLRISTFWLSMVAIWLRLCSVFLFDAPIRHHKALEDLFVDKIVYQRNYKRIMKTLLDDWSDASLLATVLWTANMAFLAIPMPGTTESTYTPAQLSLLQTAAVTCSLFSTVFSVGSITLGLINTRKHRGEPSYKEIADFLQSAHHRHFGFRPLAIVYALPIALLMWAVLSFAGAIVLYCLMATSIIPRVALLTLGAFLMGCTFATVWYFWQRETRWGYDVEGVSPRRSQRMRIANWFWGLTHFPTN